MFFVFPAPARPGSGDPLGFLRNFTVGPAHLLAMAL